MATAQITSERIDDIPLLIQWLLNMHIDKIIDAVVKPPHGNRQGLSYGQLTVVFLVYILTTCNHFLSPVRDWVTKHQHVLTLALGWPLQVNDFTDDRLEDLLDAVGQEAVGEALEEQLGQPGPMNYRQARPGLTRPRCQCTTSRQRRPSWTTAIAKITGPSCANSRKS